MPNESIEILNSKGKKIGNLECSLKKNIQNAHKKDMKLRIIQASYTVDLDTLSKMDPFVVVKYNHQNYKTKTVQDGGKTPVFKE